ncbi:ubiquinol-cytochrome C chaperone family protein [Maritalea sp.]|uniref:ubiquinol-cytochrome C chaperone family protein n=1 Tax=Maritalea sp. TaxID=2003361 RepID=UPI003EFAA9B2
MIFNPFRKDPYAEAALAAYNIIVAQSRHPDFYLSYDIADNVTGRFDMIALHMSLVFHRLHKGDVEQRKFAQSLFDLFFKDMDRSLREMGVGDITVPKKVKKMGEVFYGLLGAVKGALDEKDIDGLTAALDRNLYNEENSKCAEELAKYTIGQVGYLEGQNEFLQGLLNFLSPEQSQSSYLAK